MNNALTRCLLTGLATMMLGAQTPVTPGIHPADMDLAVPASQNFFLYANGAWIRNHPIPNDRSAWDAWSEVEDRNTAVLKRIVEEAAQARAPKGSLPQKIGDFFASGMDVRARTVAGLAPLKSTLAAIDAINNAHDLAVVLGQSHLEGIGAAFSFWVDQDDKVSTAYIAQFAQGGLGLPDRDSYLDTDKGALELRSEYLAHVTRMFTLMGVPARLAKGQADLVLAFETRLARASMTEVELKDPIAAYHKMPPADLGKIAPGLDWNSYFKTIGLEAENILVRQPAFFKELAAMAKDTGLDQWKIYLDWQVLHGWATRLSPAVEQEHFAFFGTTLTGAKEMKPLWKRVLNNTDTALGEALGQLYVEQAFSPAAKAEALEMVGNLRAALRERILKLDWMSPGTKDAALKKLSAMTAKVGYPDRWRDYTALEVTRDSYAENLRRANIFEFKRNLAKLGHPIDRQEWQMTPPTVNADYNFQMNEITLPAGILQPPFFDPRADAAVNYGAIGVVIGHELTHAFDDQGRKYDAQGNLNEWWTPGDQKAYESRLGLMVNQFDELEALPGLHVNGQLTLGENIADLGGLMVAHAALQKAMEHKPSPGKIDGFSPEQRFFLGYAQAAHAHAREEVIRLRIKTDSHAPDAFRVNAPLADLPEFQKAFACAEGTPMNRPADKRPSIW